MKLTILVDMDDVLEDLLPAWTTWLNNKHGTSVKPEDIVEWQIDKFFPELKREEVYAPLSEDEFWKTVKPKEGAVEGLKELCDGGDLVYVVTNSHYKALQSKMENVLFKYFPFLNWSNVIITSKKQLIEGDILIDDAVQNLVGGDYIRILVDAPYNRSADDEADGLCRCYDWDDILDCIEFHRVELEELYQDLREGLDDVLCGKA